MLMSVREDKDVVLAAGVAIPTGYHSYDVVSGLVELQLPRADGAAPIVRLCTPGSQICPSSVHGYAAITRLPSRLRPARRDDHEGFARDLSRILLLHTPQTALAKLWMLLQLYQNAFSVARGSKSLVLPLSTIDLAFALGLELRTISRSMGVLKRQGLVVNEACGVWRLVEKETAKDVIFPHLVPITGG